MDQSVLVFWDRNRGCQGEKMILCGDRAGKN